MHLRPCRERLLLALLDNPIQRGNPMCQLRKSQDHQAEATQRLQLRFFDGRRDRRGAEEAEVDATSNLGASRTASS